MTTAELTTTLEGLLQTARDGQQGYETAAENTSSTMLQPVLRDLARERAEYGSDLVRLLDDLGVTPNDGSGSIVGALHRVWIDMKTTLMSDDANAVIEACIRGDEAALDNYRSALSEPMPDHVMQIIQQQADGINSALDRLRTMQTTTS